MSCENQPGQCFDAYASNYDDAINSGISVSGENREYFARMRIEWLARCLSEIGESPRTAIDFGCGIGSAAGFLLDSLNLQAYHGIDTSSESISVARQSSSDSRAMFYEFHDFKSDGSADLVFCNGVFHHIPVTERPGAVDYILKSLKPGGLFAFWDNNPWNPGTQYVMRRIPFDRDAVKISAAGARKLMRSRGFEIVTTHHLFIFPKFLRGLRGIEPGLSRLPLGAQYQVLCRKPK